MSAPIQPKPDISIVIVNYNSYMYTAQCLDSLRRHPPTASIEIIVVDNASIDDSALRLEREYPEINLVRSSRNKGIAGGNNAGIRAGDSKFVLLLNNDTIVLPGSIDRSFRFLKGHPEAGGVGGNLLNPDGTFQSGPIPFPSLLEEFLNLTKLGIFLRSCYPSYKPYNEIITVDWMSTAFMLFRRSVLEEVEFVDEEFFIYSDETDLEFRISQAGWKLYYLPDVNTIHFGGKSMEPWRSRKLKYRGRLLFFRKHYPPWQEVFVRIMYAVASALKIIFWALVYIVPTKRYRAKNELKSQIEIWGLSVTHPIAGAVPQKAQAKA